VDSAGEVISETYWRGRKNNFTDLDVMMLANTVTGAASMFRADLLDRLLPFPDRVGDAFHDHWIGLTAMVRGPLGYVNEPLYDYVQHQDAVIGHADFATPTAGARLRRLATAPFRKSFWSGMRQRLISGRQAALNIHRYECRRLELISDTLILRYPKMKSRHLRTLNAYGRGMASGATLLAKHLSVVARGASTNNAEVRLGLGYIVHSLEPLRLRFAGRRAV